MAQTIKLKRSGTSGRLPTTSDLELGEVAINTYDGKMYIKKNVGGTESIVEIGAQGGGIASSFTLYEYTATSGQTTFSGSDGNSNTLAYDTGTPPKILVYLNGVLLDHTTDYTATNGTSVVLTNGAATNDLLQIAAYESSVSTALDIDLSDSQKILFGDDDDLEIYHNGSNGFIKNTTGDLYIEDTNGSIRLRPKTGESGINILADAAVELYYDNAKKLETTSGGIQVQGAMAATTGAYSPIYYGGSSSLQLKSNAGELFGQFTNNGAAELYYDNSKKFETTSTGIDVTGTVTADGLTFGTNHRIQGTGILFLGGSSATAFEVGAGSEKMRLTSTGLGIGTQSPGNPLEIQHSTVGTGNGSNNTLALRYNSTTLYGQHYMDANGIYHILADNSGVAGGNLQLNADTTLRFATGSTPSERMRIDSSGNVGIAETTPLAKFEVGGSIKSTSRDTSHTAEAGVTLSYDTSNSIALLETWTSKPLLTRTYNYQAFDISGTEAMRIAADSNVGIGDTSPDYKLHVNSGATNVVAKFESTDSTAAIQFLDNTGNVEIGATGSKFTVNPAGGVPVIEASATDIIFNNNGDDVNFRVESDTSPNAFSIDGATGNIGMGTATPDEFGIGSTYKYLAVGGDKPGIINLVDSGTSGSFLQFGTAAGVRRASIHAENSADLAFTLNSSNTGTNLTERIRIKASNGNVGIGTSSPGHKVTISDTSGTVTRLQIDNTGNAAAGAGIYLRTLSSGTQVSNATIRTGNNGDFSIWTGTTGEGQRLTIDSTGNVGIGTSSPDSKLTVNVTSNSDGIELQSSETKIATLSRTAVNSQVVASLDGVASRPIHIGGIVNEDVILANAGGNVGVGITSPAFAFHAYHATTNVVSRFESGDSQVWIDLHDSNSGTYGALLGHDGNAGQLFMVADQGVNRRFIIDTSGQVSIGTNVNPVARLQVEVLGIDTTTTSTTATTQVVIDTFAAATFRSARYTIQVTNSTDSTYHLTEVLLIHDGTTPQITEYGTIFTGSAEATFDADISSGNVRLLATPATTDSMTFKVVRHCITV